MFHAKCRTSSSNRASCKLIFIMKDIISSQLKEEMDYDAACFMHLSPGVVHNFTKAVGV